MGTSGLRGGSILDVGRALRLSCTAAAWAVGPALASQGLVVLNASRNLQPMTGDLPAVLLKALFHASGCFL